MHIRWWTERKRKNSIKKENQSKQTKNTVNSVANMQDQQQSHVTIPKWTSYSKVQLRNAEQRIYLSRSNWLGVLLREGEIKLHTFLWDDRLDQVDGRM